MERNPHTASVGAHTRRLLYLALLAGLTAAVPGRPALGADAPRHLSLTEAIELALANNPDMAIAVLKIREAEGLAKTIKSSLWPQVSAYASERRQQRSTEAFGFSDSVGFVSQLSGDGGTITELRFETQPDEVIGPFNVAEAMLRAAMPLLDLETWNLREAADAGLHLVDLQRAAVRDDVLTQTATLYLSALVKEEAVRALSQKVDLRERRLKLIEDESRAGTATDYNVKRDRLLLVTARTELLRTHQELDAAKRSLCRVIGCQSSDGIALTDSLQVQGFSLPDRDAAVDLALLTRPDYLAGRQSVVVAAHDRDAATGKRWPRADLFGSYGKQGESFDGSVDAWGVGVGVTMSVWDAGKRSGEIQQK
ncbi:TolC family protein [bacterium]|nr:TolC family protein [bacterium]